MKFDNIIVGGGLSGLICGIQLAKAQKHVAIVAAGQSSLHFSSGSFDLLGYDKEQKEILYPLSAMESLSDCHPYKKIGVGEIERLAEEAKNLLKDAGIPVKGEAHKNHFRITPMGLPKPTWLTQEDYATSESRNAFPYKKILLANIVGYLDFPIEFIKDGLKAMGAYVNCKSIATKALKYRRKSPTEMRSANIAKILTQKDTLQEIASWLNKEKTDEEAILMPAVVGLESREAIEFLRSQVNDIPIFFLPTLPPSVPGVRVQTQLRKYFTKLGGLYLMGDSVKGGLIEDNTLRYIETTNLPDERLEANDFVLATGSFQSNGLKSNYQEVYEPIFHLDVDAEGDHTEWSSPDVFAEQAFMSFGVSTAEDFICKKDGRRIENLYAIGSVLSGHNSIRQADGRGVDILTAMKVAEQLSKKTIHV